MSAIKQSYFDELDQLSPFEILVYLKRQERDLIDKIKLAQEEAIAYALSTGETGQVANIDGAKVTLKLVTVKPTSPMIKALKEDIDDFRSELKVKNGDRLAQLEAEIYALTTDEEIQELEEKLALEMAKMEGEKKPQIAVTLPK